MSELLPNRNIDLRDKGGLIFYEEEHAYYNADGVKYTGMTTFLKAYEGESFDGEKISKYKAIKETLPVAEFTKLKRLITSKLHEPSSTSWTKIHLFYEKLCISSAHLGKALLDKRQEILDLWEKASTDGSIEHDKREKEVIENGVEWNGKHYPYANKNILEVTKDDVCVIPEIMTWNHNSETCGLVDLPIFDKGVIHVLDYKTNKKIERNGFMGRTMKYELSSLPDANFYKYSCQLEGYLDMMCKQTGFTKGETWIISTAHVEYKRKEDIYIQCEPKTRELMEKLLK